MKTQLRSSTDANEGSDLDISEEEYDDSDADSLYREGEEYKKGKFGAGG